MLAVRLTLRLITGAGPAGRVRLALTALGVALGVVATLFALAVPRFLEAGADRASDRFPRAAIDGQAATFAYSIVGDDYKGRPWLQIFLAPPSAGASAPAPPGVPRFPFPGETFVSPEVQRIIDDDMSAVARAPGTAAGTIGPAGLAQPEELVSYVGVEADELPDGGAAASGFGVASGLSGPPVSPTAVRLEMALLVGLPAAAYLATCAQLSAASRMKRLAALRLLGLSRKSILRVSALESGTAGGVGALAGLAMFAALNPAAAQSGVLGFSWFSGDSAVGTTASGVMFVAVSFLAARLGSAGARRVIDRPLAARREPDSASPSALRLLPLVVSAGLLGPVVVVGLFTDGPRLSGSGGSWLVIGGSALAIVGLLLAVRPLLSRVTRRLTGQRRSLAVRLAARRLQFEPGSALRVVTGLMLLTVLGGVAPAVLHDAKLAAGPQAEQVAMTVAGSDAPTSNQRSRITGIPARAHIAFLRSAMDETALESSAQSGDVSGLALAAGVETVFAPCRDFAVFVSRQVTACADGQAYRLEDDVASTPANAVPAGVPLMYADSSLSLQTPEPVLVIPNLLASGLGPNTILVAEPGPPRGGWPADTSFTLLVDADDDRIEQTRSAIKAVVPRAGVVLLGRDVDQLEAYRLHRGVILLGLALGLTLGVLAFVLSSVDRALERRSNVAALLVIGVPRRVLRVAQVGQLLIPLTVGLGLAGFVGQMIGWGYLAASGLERGVFLGGLQSTVATMSASVVMAVAAGVIVVGKRIRVELLRRD